MFFVGRQEELAELNAKYSSNKFEFTVIYGRRRVGKTYLIQNYIQDKEAIYYMATKTGDLNLERLSSLLNIKMGLGDSGPVYRNYFDLFKVLANLAKTERLIFVIDEFPYLAEGNPEISTIIQSMCDKEWKDSKLHFILCGSSMSFMRKQVLSAESPLYGRRTSQIRLSPFNFFETKEMLAGMSKEDIAILHAASGGVADYLSYIDLEKSADENLLSLFMRPSGRLYEEPASLLNQELSSPAIYNQILYAMANGATRNIEISDMSRLPSSQLSPYLANLLELDIIKKERPYGSKSNRKTLYFIKDGCFRFYYRYILKYQSQIASGNGESIYFEFIKDDLSNFMGQAFEDITYDILTKLNRDISLPGIAGDFGRWWGYIRRDKGEEEIDLVGEGRTFAFFAEVKWRNRDFSLNEIKKLIDKSRWVSLNKEKNYYIAITKDSFSKDLEVYAHEHDDVLLYSFARDF